MKHIFPLFSLLFSFFILIITPANTQAATPSLSKSFGGRVYLAPIPGITCNGAGRLMLLSSNANSILSTVGSQGSMSSSEAKGFVKNLHGALPIYASNPQKSPTPGGQILGRKSIIPDMQTCYIPTPAGPVYIPILKTAPLTNSNYQVSR
ncbi:MAG: hypothetical protein WC059_00340 [Candidatus Paceibacterota bacterium]